MQFKKNEKRKKNHIYIYIYITLKATTSLPPLVNTGCPRLSGITQNYCERQTSPNGFCSCCYFLEGGRFGNKFNSTQISVIFDSVLKGMRQHQQWWHGDRQGLHPLEKYIFLRSTMWCGVVRVHSLTCTLCCMHYTPVHCISPRRMHC